MPHAACGFPPPPHDRSVVPPFACRRSGGEREKLKWLNAAYPPLPGDSGPGFHPTPTGLRRAWAGGAGVMAPALPKDATPSGLGRLAGVDSRGSPSCLGATPGCGTQPRCGWRPCDRRRRQDHVLIGAMALAPLPTYGPCHTRSPGSLDSYAPSPYPHFMGRGGSKAHLFPRPACGVSRLWPRSPKGQRVRVRGRNFVPSPRLRGFEALAEIPAGSKGWGEGKWSCQS